MLRSSHRDVKEIRRSYSKRRQRSYKIEAIEYTSTSKIQPYIFAVQYNFHLDARQLGKSLEFGFAEALMDLSEPNEIFRHIDDLI
jgi:hypothetical protein